MEMDSSFLKNQRKALKSFNQYFGALLCHLNQVQFHCFWEFAWKKLKQKEAKEFFFCAPVYN